MYRAELGPSGLLGAFFLVVFVAYRNLQFTADTQLLANLSTQRNLTQENCL